MRENLHWIVLAGSICFFVGVVIVSRQFRGSVETRFSTEKQVMDELEEIAEKPLSFHRDVESLSGIDNDLNREIDSNIATNGAIPLESSMQNTLEESNVESSQADEEEEDKVMTWYQQAYQEELEKLRVRIEEGIAKIEPLFEEMDIYKIQLESLHRQERWEEYGIVRRKWKEARNELLNIYTFLRHEQIQGLAGHLYLSTPQYAMLKQWAEDWYARNRRD